MLRSFRDSLQRSSPSTFRTAFVPEALAAIATAFMSMLLAGLLLGYPDVPLSIPSTYTGDALFYGMLIKGTLENGWYFNNPSLGAPFGLTMGPFPMVDGTHFLMIRLIGLFTEDYGSAFTSFLLLSFATSSLSAYFVLRRISASILISCSGALLFSLQAYHFLRGGGHLFLASYFSIPVYVWFALELYEESPFNCGWGKRLGLVGLLLLSIAGGVYYAFFGCVLIGFASISSSIDQARWRPFLTGLAILATIAIGVLINLAPHVSYGNRHSAESNISLRLPEDSETYGLKPIQLVLPSPAHRQPEVHAWVTQYNSRAPLTNENTTSSLGLFGTIGLLLSIAAFMLLRSPLVTPLVSRLGGFNIVLIAYATVGGIGSLVAWTITPQLRGLNRISIFIAFISIAAFCILLNILLGKLNNPMRRIVTVLAVVSVAVFGWWDQTPNWIPTMTKAGAARFARDAETGKELMKMLAPGSRVYELPFVAFPEAPANNNEGLYGLSRWYLHTHRIQWSYPAMKGSEAEQWLRHIESMPIPMRLGTLSASGFSAVLVDRTAYADGGKAMEDELSNTAGPAQFICPDMSCAVFNLHSGMVPRERPLLLATLGNGWSTWETDQAGTQFVWSIGNRPSRVYLMNPLSTPLQSRLRFSIVARHALEIKATIEHKIVANQEIQVAETRHIDVNISLPAGITALELESSIPAELASPTDARIIGFQLRNLTIDATEAEK